MATLPIAVGLYNSRFTSASDGRSILIALVFFFIAYLTWRLFLSNLGLILSGLKRLDLGFDDNLLRYAVEIWIDDELIAGEVILSVFLTLEFRLSSSYNFIGPSELYNIVLMLG